MKYLKVIIIVGLIAHLPVYGAEDKPAAAAVSPTARPLSPERSEALKMAQKKIADAKVGPFNPEATEAMWLAVGTKKVYEKVQPDIEKFLL